MMKQESNEGQADAGLPARVPVAPIATTRPAAGPVDPLPGVHRIELSLRNIDQLFNTMDPSPFHEKDLDHDAEEFILGWAEEFHRHEPLALVVHLEQGADARDAQRTVQDAIHHYFAYRARLNQLEFKRLMKQGRTSLVVGLSFLGACLLVIELVLANRLGTLPNLLAQSLTIAGWVAMWRPMEIYLYEWWPLRRRGHILGKLSTMPVEVRSRGESASAAQPSAH
jgi:hypothetical protein